MHSASLYNMCTAGYVLSLVVFAVHVLNTKKFWLKLGVLTVAFSFLIQTAGMLLRWVEAGFMEVKAAESAVGQSLTGWSWFVVFTQHPPWSNLYEIMVYMSWGVIIVTLGAELKWRLAWVRQFGVILALMALGMASLTDSSIKPLVPALKSWWIMIHVISASIAYAAGAIAAFISLFAILKDKKRIDTYKIAGLSLLFTAMLLFFIGGGPRLFIDQAFYVKLLGFAGDSIVNVMDMSKDQGRAFLVSMPLVGWLLLLSVILHSFLGGIILCFYKEQQHNNKVKTLFWFAFISSFICLLVVLFHDLRQSSIEVSSNIAHHLLPSQGPWFISFKSHPWSFGLLVFTILVEGFLLFYLLNSDGVTNKLPKVDTLEMASYKAISLSFFLMTVVLITGALWAHYAWGRYWAWDPKETGALAIWLNYAIYLHTKRTSGLSGPFSSFIAILGFFVIIIGFLGVNLGLFADGLHTYGNN